MLEIFKIKVYTDGDLEYQQEYNNLGQAIEDYAKYRTRGMARNERLVALISPTGDVIVKKSLRNLHSV
jgi:hypothetical protein